MRYYQATCSTISLIRKNGHYPSLFTARRLSQSLAWVFEQEKEEEGVKGLLVATDKLVKILTGFVNLDAETGDDKLRFDFTPKQNEIIDSFLIWFAEGGNRDAGVKSFVAAALNAGRTLVITERFERKTTSLS